MAFGGSEADLIVKFIHLLISVMNGFCFWTIKFMFFSRMVKLKSLFTVRDYVFENPRFSVSGSTRHSEFAVYYGRNLITSWIAPVDQ